MKRFCGIVAVLSVGLTLISQNATAAMTGVEAFTVAIAGKTRGDSELNEKVLPGVEGAVLVAFGARSDTSNPAHFEARLYVNQATSGTAFSGDYNVAAGLQMRVRANDGVVPDIFTIHINCANRTWSYFASDLGTLPNSDPDLWSVYSIPLDPAKLVPSDGDSSTFADDMKEVNDIWVWIQPDGYPAQSYTVDNVVLQSAEEFSEGVTTLTMLQAALLDAFGVDNVGALSGDQKDQIGLVDGMPDVEVFRILYERGYYALEGFTVNAAVAGNGMTIQWRALEDGEYTIYKSEDLLTGFTELTTRTVTGISGVGMVQVDDPAANGAGPYFYKIVQTNGN